MSRLVSDESWAVMTIWLEARGEPYASKVGVAEVIRNRMAARYQSDGTVPGTVLKAYQFSCWNDGTPSRKHAASLDWDDPIVQECLRAWQEAQAGSQRAHGAVSYLNPHALPPGTIVAWARDDHHVATLGAHEFYRA